MGTVYLVGGGPGDPGLLTVRAARLLRRADVVVHDALIAPEILRLAPPGAEMVDVGKRCGGRHTAQERIHELLLDAAHRARVVVRLKGGDPFVFGRGGEEALALREAGVRFRVVPGITAAVGVGAYAGIPLTHRGASSGVTLVTGRECAALDRERLDWQRLGRAGETLVVYMGTRRLAEIAARLIRAGRAPSTPAAVVHWGTTPRQRTVEAPLSGIADAVARAGLGAPALVIVGEVVSLRRRIGWFEARPLHGVRVLVPRSRGQPSRLARALAARGADVVESPRLVVRALPAPGALGAIDRYRWVMFTSPTAVGRFWDELLAGGMDVRALARLRFACFGTATAAALLRRGVRADLAVPSFTARRALEAFGGAPAVAARVFLFPRDEGEPSELAATLRGAGARVDEVALYREDPHAGEAEEVRRALRAGEIRVVAFASSGAVRAFVAHHGPSVGGAAVAVIGEATAAAARSAGIPVHRVSRDSTLRGLIREIHAHATELHSRRDEPGAAAGGARLAPERRLVLAGLSARGANPPAGMLR